MIRIIFEPGKPGEPITGLLYHDKGKLKGTVKILQSLPRKPGQKEYEWEEVKPEWADES